MQRGVLVVLAGIVTLVAVWWWALLGMTVEVGTAVTVTAGLLVAIGTYPE
jgi:hypothetical protein